MLNLLKSLNKDSFDWNSLKNFLLFLLENVVLIPRHSWKIALIPTKHVNCATQKHGFYGVRSL